jgi:ParB/RepB/Spo0J family partition protein
MKKNTVKTENEKDATNAWKPVATGGTSGLKPVLANIPPHTIGIAKNIRRHEITPETDPSLPELVQSIRQIGILEPLIVNQPAGFTESAFTLVAGHRRLAAAKIAQLSLVPAVVYTNLDAKQILEIQITENIHRVDLSPVEEAETYVRMRDELGMTVEDIAARVGRSTRHVYRYIALLNLPQEAINKIGEDGITISKALVLATLPPRIVTAVVNDFTWILDDNTAKYLPDAIKYKFMEEFDDRFDKERSYTDRDGKTLPPCSKCPNRGQMELFEEYMSDNTCPDGDCFYSKARAADKEKRDAAREQMEGDEGGLGDVDDDFDNSYQMSKEERERREAAYAAQRAKDFKERREEAEKSYTAADYYLSKKAAKGFSPQDFFLVGTECNGIGYNRDNEYQTSHRKDFDRLLVKYVGKPFDAIRESGTADEVIMTALAYEIYEHWEYSGEEIAEWIGCEEYGTDEEDKDEEDEEED